MAHAKNQSRKNIFNKARPGQSIGTVLHNAAEQFVRDAKDLKVFQAKAAARRAKERAKKKATKDGEDASSHKTKKGR